MTRPAPGVRTERRPVSSPTTATRRVELLSESWERHGPWAFEVREWLTPHAAQALVRLRPEQGKKHATELLRRHPELVALMPALLDGAHGTSGPTLGALVTWRELSQARVELRPTRSHEEAPTDRR